MTNYYKPDPQVSRDDILKAIRDMVDETEIMKLVDLAVSQSRLFGYREGWRDGERSGTNCPRTTP